MQDLDRKSARHGYPAGHISPWVFVFIAGTTLFFILSGVFRFEPVMRVFHWLAIVL